MNGSFRVGTSGYHYEHWRSIFYPEDLPKEDWFSYYAEIFNTVEINNTFYRLPEASICENWYERAPEGFCYVLKFSRYGSHMKKLLDPESTIGNFMERANKLREYLGPILVQLPPHWGANPERLKSFLSVAPTDQRWAIEFRDADWLRDEVFEILASLDSALCIHDGIQNHPKVTTTSWTYLRYHGRAPEGKYNRSKLEKSAAWIRDRLKEGLDVYAYFNNDIGGHAVENAKTLRDLVINF